MHHSGRVVLNFSFIFQKQFGVVERLDPVGLAIPPRSSGSFSKASNARYASYIVVAGNAVSEMRILTTLFVLFAQTGQSQTDSCFMATLKPEEKETEAVINGTKLPNQKVEEAHVRPVFFDENYEGNYEVVEAPVNKEESAEKIKEALMLTEPKTHESTTATGRIQDVYG